MNKKLSAEAPSGTNEAATQSANALRRRVLLAGLAAAPVILTLKSRSVFAQSGPPLSCNIVESILAGSSQQAGVETLRPQDQECNPSGR